MSEIDSLGTSYYFSGVKNLTNEVLKKQKIEKSSSAKKTKFVDFFKTKEEESDFITKGLPPEIKNMSFENATIFLKDAVDIAGNELANSITQENIENFKNAVSQFIRFVVSNNYEVNYKRKRRKEFVSPIGMFSNYNTMPRLKDPKVQINIINEKLEQLTKETMKTQMNNFLILQKADEIKGLIIDLMSS